MPNKNKTGKEYGVICIGAVAIICSGRVALGVLSHANDVLSILPLIIVGALGLVSYVYRCEAKYKWLAMAGALFITAVVLRFTVGLPLVLQSH